MNITHKDKILFPKEGIAKGEVALYYAKIAKKMLPFLRGRPLSMHRFPRGIHHPGFFQKRAPVTPPEGMKTVNVQRKNGSSFPMLLCETKKDLLWLANQNCVTPHIWSSKFDAPHLPDRMIFDLDPETKGQFPIAVQGALLLRKILKKRGLTKAFVMTTGSKGLHVLVPIPAKDPFEKIRAQARKIAEAVVELYPEKFTLEIRKNKRKGRVYLDVLRNGQGQTSVAPYSIRALDGAPIATPLSWKELENKKLRSDTYTLRNISSRWKKNPWKGFF